MANFPTPSPNSRIGFYYYPDTFHFRESDLHTWVPQLHILGATWLVLQAPLERAIPEYFLRGLLASGIEPVLHSQLELKPLTDQATCKLLFEQYAGWGVHYLTLFDRPNLRSAWPTSAWAQSDLVERFLDLFLPYAQIALQAGLVPVFPPLEPGGDFWDTAFLRAALRSLQRRRHTELLDGMAYGAYAWAGNRPLQWGAGGPERWPSARPYFLPPGVQDQRGFRIFDWYSTLIKAELGDARPLILIGGGSCIGDDQDPESPAVDLEAHTRQNLGIVRMLRGEVAPLPGSVHQLADSTPNDAGSHPPEDSLSEEVPEEVLACNFWLLTAGPESEYLAHAWFQPDGATLPIVGVMRQWAGAYAASVVAKTPGMNPHDAQPSSAKTVFYPAASPHPIGHYLLLPLYEWGVAEWHLDVIRGFVRKHHPTIGFSVEEACLAQQVTILGNAQSIPEVDEDRLKSCGCQVSRISGNGTSIATQLNSL
jgi:hypothetical protein